MLEICLGNTTVENTGGGCMVMFTNVLSNGKLQQISYDGETIVGLNCKYQEAEEGIQPENQLWYADDWHILMDIVGIKVTLDIADKVEKNWQFTDHMKNKEVVWQLQHLIDFTSSASQISDSWLEEFGCGYPFDKSFDEVLIDIFNWQQVCLNQVPMIYQRLRKMYERGLIGFESRNSGQMVQNPFVDESLRWGVDPIEYYGFDIIFALAGKTYDC